ncbi:MAG: hypothetical protein HY906_02715 [Deltaproteobacteria bacterium]|nr:hypothetical protein [Deltaproteobacteria bacterium]
MGRRLVWTLAGVMVLAVWSGCGGERSASGDGGAGDGQSPSYCDKTPARDPSCDDPALKARYDACQVTHDEADCTQAGGNWIPGSDGGFGGIAHCSCSTGQVGCPCCRSTDCISVCFDAYTPINECEKATYWHCMDRGPINPCFCTRGPTGELGGLCID